MIGKKNIERTFKGIIGLAILFLSHSPIFAQEEETSPIPTEPSTVITSSPDLILSQHWAMPTLLNPAATGEIDYIRIRGGARLERLGIYHSPKYFLGAVDAPFKLMGKRIGAGIIVNSQNYDLYRNIQVSAQGSYKLQFKKSTLSIGIQLGYYHSKYKGSEFIINNTGNPGGLEPGTGGNENLTKADLDGDIEGDEGPGSEEIPDDPYEEMPTMDVAGGALDVAVGVRFDHPWFHVGLSALHLTNPRVKLSTEGESSSDSRYIESKMPISLYFDAGGNIPIHNSLFTLQPSVIVGSDFSNFATVIEMRATYNQLVTFGANYRWNQAVGVLAGISIKNFFLGYSWEYDYRPIAKKSTGNHEIVLGYQLKLDMGGKNLFRHRSIRLM